MAMFYLKQAVLTLIINIPKPAIGSGLIDKTGIWVHSTYHITNSVASWGPELAVDGDARRIPMECNCCAFTMKVPEPFYQVNLGQVYNIKFVDVIGVDGDDYPDPYEHSLRNMRVTYGINSYDAIEMFTNSAAVYVVYHNLSTSVPGRYMRFTLVGTVDYFIICELYVYSECDDGRYGRDCVTCVGQCLNGAPCNKTDGTCKSCAAGYKGKKCNQVCSPGEYGPDCAERCGHCKHGNTTCNRFDGSCIECQQGYMVPLCKECNHGHYGASCLEQCGFCKDNVTCNRLDGSCLECAAGYTGVMCKQKLKECNCNDEKGHLHPAIIGGTIGAILFLGAVIVTVILLWRKRSKDKHYDTADADATTTESFQEMPDP